jgi:hypothetical protein
MLVADSPTNHPNAISGRSRSRVSTCQLMVMHSFFTQVYRMGTVMRDNSSEATSPAMSE